MPSQTTNGFPKGQEFLSNSYPSPIGLRKDGQSYEFTCVEAAYQGLMHPEHIREFEGISGEQAIELGKQYKPAQNWDNLKFSIMERLIDDKFRLNEDLLPHLIATADQPIVNVSDDPYWGKNGREGTNNLGRILESTRDMYIRAISKRPFPSPERESAREVIQRRDDAFVWMRHVPDYVINRLDDAEMTVDIGKAGPVDALTTIQVHQYDIQNSGREGFADIRLYRGSGQPAEVKATCEHKPGETTVQYLNPEELAASWNKQGAKEMTAVPEEWLTEIKDGTKVKVDMPSTEGRVEFYLDANQIRPGTDSLGRKVENKVNFDMSSKCSIPVIHIGNDGTSNTEIRSFREILDSWDPRQSIYTPKQPTPQEPKVAIRTSRNTADLDAAAEAITGDGKGMSDPDFNY